VGISPPSQVIQRGSGHCHTLDRVNTVWLNNNTTIPFVSSVVTSSRLHLYHHRYSPSSQLCSNETDFQVGFRKWCKTANLTFCLVGYENVAGVRSILQIFIDQGFNKQNPHYIRLLQCCGCGLGSSSKRYWKPGNIYIYIWPWGRWIRMIKYWYYRAEGSASVWVSQEA
jgi:hypothetical protein